MTTFLLPPETAMRRAFAEKDPSFDGLFVVAVKTTGIFCRPVCKARAPLAQNIEFFPNAATAEREGYRACKLCRPTAAPGEPSPLVKRLVELIDASPDRLHDADLQAQGIEPTTARRQFKAHFGMSFSAYQRARRMGTALTELRSGDRVLAAQLEAGFASPSAFREAFGRLFGVAPANAAAVSALTACLIPTPLGPMLAVANDDGLALLDFTDRRGLETAIGRLRKRFKAVVLPGNHPHLKDARRQLEEYFAGKRVAFDLKLNPPGSPFEREAWTYLTTIPPGQTRSYGEQARGLGRPGASRAVGRANGMNYLSIVIPCHRVVGAAGNLTGYGGGLHRKKWLLEHERPKN